MHSYAQTIIQLYNELQSEGYSNSDLIIIRNTYDLAKSIFTGHFQPSGKIFISHGVGTASILASRKLPIHLIAAGLIHNVYLKGDFGDGIRGISKSRRNYLKHIIGKEVEEYVAGFATMRWNLEVISTISDKIDELSLIDRDIILLHLADHLEHLLDLDVLYFNETGSQQYINTTHFGVELAKKLGFIDLAIELERIGKEVKMGKIPAELITQHKESFTIAPKSYRKRLSVLLFQEFNHLRSIIKIRKMRKLLMTAKESFNKV